MNEFGENHYRVVRFYPHGGHGTIEETLASDLTLEEAQRLADTEAPVTSDEQIMIQDQAQEGLAAIVRLDHLAAE